MLEAVLKIDLQKSIVETMVVTEDEYLKLQKDQLLHGLNAKGEEIGFYRNEDYADKKHRQNPKAGFGNVDLKLTGSFYEGISTHISNEGFLIESSDAKAPALEKKYGDPFGLADERKQSYADLSGQILVNEISKQM